MAGGSTGAGGVKVDFWRDDDVMWWGKHESFAHGVEKWGADVRFLWNGRGDEVGMKKLAGASKKW